MEPRNLLKPDFETYVTFEPLGVFLCDFHCCAKENELFHIMFVFVYVGVSLNNIFSMFILISNYFLLNKFNNHERKCRYNPEKLDFTEYVIAKEWLFHGLLWRPLFP